MSDWHSTTLQEIISTIESGSRPKGGVRIGDNSEGVPSYGGENISMIGGMLYDSVRMVPTDFATEMRRGVLSDKDVLINKDGANTGKSAIYRKPAGEGFATINEHLFLLRCNKSIAEQEFLYHFINSEFGKSQIARVITGSAQPGLNSTFPEFVRIDLPPLPEQKKIAEILSGIDLVKKKLANRLARQILLKDALVSDLLFAKIKSEEYTCLHVLSDRITDGTHQAVKISTEGRIPFLYVSCVRNGIIDWSKTGFINEEQYSTATQGRQPKTGDILYTAVGATYGHAAMVQTDFRFCFQRHIALIQLKQEKVHPKFIELALSSRETKRLVDIAVTGNAQPSITLGELKVLQIPAPPLERQKEIVEIIRPVEKLIASIGIKLNSLEFTKKSLSSDLLSGRKRVSI